MRFVVQTLREAPALLAADRTRPQRLPPPLLPPLRGRRVEQLEAGRRRDVQRPHPRRSRSPPPSAGSASTGPSATARCSSPAPSTSRSIRSARCSTTSSRPRSRVGPTAPIAASSPTCRPPARRARQALFDYADANGFDVAEGGRLRRLHLRPADARGGRLPRGGQPRDAPRGPRPQARAGSSSTSTRRRAPRSRSCRSARSGVDPADVASARSTRVARDERAQPSTVGSGGASR